MFHPNPLGRTSGGIFMLRVQCSLKSWRLIATVSVGSHRNVSKQLGSKGTCVPFLAVTITRCVFPSAYPNSMKQFVRTPVRSTKATSLCWVLLKIAWFIQLYSYGLLPTCKHSHPT